MLAGTSNFLAPVLEEPNDLDWTQVVGQGNTYTLNLEPEVTTIMAKSSAPVHSLGFVFNADEALDPGETSVPLAESIKIE